MFLFLITILNAEYINLIKIKLELGISPENIKSKLISILTFHKIDKKILEDADMAGPLLVLILFGFTLALVINYK